MDDFLHFLRTGEIHGLRVGSDQAEVRAAMGPPEDTSARRPLIWKYEQAEITFCEDEVLMIAVSVAADARAMQQLLDDEGLRYAPHADLTYDRQVAFVVAPSSVTLTLDLEHPLARAFAT